MSNPEARARVPTAPLRQRRQRGVLLIELLIGLFLGLLVVVAALGALAVSHGAATTVADMAHLQQQGAYVLRVMGLQFRQAGALSPDATRGAAELFAFDDRYSGLGGQDGIHVAGTDGVGAAPDRVSVAHQAGAGLPRIDCLGDELKKSSAAMVSTFDVDGKRQLRCTGSANTHPLAGNVAGFQLHYRVRQGDGMRRMTASQVTADALWARVKAIEVCLDLQGDTLGDDGASGSYENCHGTTTARAGRLHVVLRSVFDLRTQGS